MKLRPFELGLITVFILMIAGSLILLKTYRADKNDGLPQIGKVEIWGTVPKEGMAEILRTLTEQNETYRGVSYRAVEASAFTSTLVNALADGTGPDMLLLSSEQLVELRSKIRPYSYDSFPLRDVQSLYVDGAQIFALQDGLYAYPLVLDPLVMYWNKDVLATQNLLEAPRTWESLVNQYVPLLTKRASDRTIEKSAIALGEYDNIRNAHGIVSTLLLQAGSFTVTEDDEGQYQIRLNESTDRTIEPLRVTTDFYTRFSRADNSLYSWNRSFSSDRDRFSSGDLALYFGFGSEGRQLEKLNPNLNFDVAEVPQGAAATARRTYATFYGLSILRSSDNAQGAAMVIRDLSTQTTVQKFADLYGMVPAFRSVVSAGSNDTYGRVTYKSAGIAYGWLSPNKTATESILGTAMREVTENRNDVTGAVTDALGRFEIEYNK